MRVKPASTVQFGLRFGQVPGQFCCSGGYRSSFQGTPGLHYTLNPDMPIRAQCGVIFRESATPPGQFSGFSGRFFWDSSQDDPDWQLNCFHASETRQYRAVWIEDRTGAWPILLFPRLSVTFSGYSRASLYTQPGYTNPGSMRGYFPKVSYPNRPVQRIFRPVLLGFIIRRPGLADQPFSCE